MVNYHAPNHFLFLVLILFLSFAVTTAICFCFHIFPFLLILLPLLLFLFLFFCFFSGFCFCFSSSYPFSPSLPSPSVTPPPLFFYFWGHTSSSPKYWRESQNSKQVSILNTLQLFILRQRSMEDIYNRRMQDHFLTAIRVPHCFSFKCSLRDLATQFHQLALPLLQQCCLN